MFLRHSMLGASLVLFGAGCLGGSPQPAAGPNGGIFRTRTDVFSPQTTEVDWKQLKLLNLGTKFGSIAAVGTVAVTFDPQDPSTIYVGTSQNGLLYSLDGGDSWQQAKGLSVGKVEAIAADHRDKCVLYVGRANQLFKTDNCGRDWNQVFYDGRTDKSFTALVVDAKNSNLVYAGTSAGDIFRSDNAGSSWRAVQRLEGIYIMTITIDPRDSQLVYAATWGAGILKSTDGGATWISHRQAFQDFDRARFVRDLVLDKNTANRLYHISKFGVLRSDDGGASWKPLNLPSPNNALDVRALAVHPKDSKKLIYATETSLGFSSDGGVTWTSRKLPTSRGASFIIFDQSASPALYLGALSSK